MRPYVLLMAISALLVSCKSDPLESGPDQAALKSQLSTELPAFIRVTDLRIEASSNAGDRVEPLFKTRFKAKIELLADTFQEASAEDGAVIIAPVETKGTTRELYGLAQSSWFAGAWKTAFSYENNPLQSLGRPRDFFTGGVVLVRGSAEETAFRNELRSKQDAAEQERLDAARREIDRIKAESDLEAARMKAAADAAAERSRIQEQTQAAQRHEAEQQGERRLRPWVVSRSSMAGKLYSQGVDIRLTFQSVDTTQKVLTGLIDWNDAAIGNLPATFRFDGRWIGDRLSATGTKIRRAGGGQEGETKQCNLILTAKAAARFEGTLCGDPIWFTR